MGGVGWFVSPEYVIHTVSHLEDSNYVFKIELYICTMSNSYIITVTELYILMWGCSKGTGSTFLLGCCF